MKLILVILITCSFQKGFDIDALYKKVNEVKIQKTNQPQTILSTFIKNDDMQAKMQNDQVYDESGMEGLQEEKFEIGTIERQQQRARSAVNVWQKQRNVQNSIFGCSLDMESIPEWLVFNVLLVGNEGAHQIIKVCLNQDENQIIHYIIESLEQNCTSKVTKSSKQNIDQNARFQQISNDTQDESSQNSIETKKEQITSDLVKNKDFQITISEVKSMKQQIDDLNSKVINLQQQLLEKDKQLEKQKEEKKKEEKKEEKKVEKKEEKKVEKKEEKKVDKKEEKKVEKKEEKKVENKNYDDDDDDDEDEKPKKEYKYMTPAEKKQKSINDIMKRLL